MEFEVFLNVVRNIDHVFFIVFGLYVDNRYNNPDYTSWEKKYDSRVEYLEQENPSLKRKTHFGSINNILKETVRDGDLREEALRKDTVLQKLEDKKPPRYLRTPLWQTLLLSVVCAFFSFILALAAIRYTIRGTIRGGKWIIEGFIEKEKQKQKG